MTAIKPPKQPNPTGRPLPSSVARDFYIARRIKPINGQLFTVQNHVAGAIITDHYGSIYVVQQGGALKLYERKEIPRLRH